jgi:hypothetical protein
LDPARSSCRRSGLRWPWSTERQVVVGGDVLIAEERDLVAEERLADVGDRGVVEVGAKIHSVDLVADRR